MKILLVRPISTSIQVVPPLSLGYLATSIRQWTKGIDVRILDCLCPKLSYDEYLQRLGEYNPDILGFQVFTNDIPSVARHIKMARIAFPNIKIVAGGAHPSGIPETVFDYLNG